MDIIIGILIVLFIICIFGNMMITDKEKQFKEKYGLPKESMIVGIKELKYNNIDLKDTGTEYISCVWIDNNIINIVARPMFCKDYGKITIPIDKIDFFTRVGDFYTSVNGGGSSVGGAIAGGVIAGEVGSVIGSRKKVDTKVVDNRTTIMQVRNSKDEIEIIKFSSSSYDTLLKIIPTKEKSLISENKEDKSNNGLHKELRELAKLRDEGILSEEEFQESKRKLLEQI